jgi:lipoprotein-anchoring transpeptidase ErfK/SrfK
MLIPNAVMLLIFGASAMLVHYTNAAELPNILKLQILLDRAGFSVGEIDGVDGSNTRKALSAFQQAHHLPETPAAEETTWQALAQDDVQLLVPYTIAPEDTKGPFQKEIPKDMMEKMKLTLLGYSCVQELIAEKFHVNPALLQRLNPSASYEVGEEILVPNVNTSPTRLVKQAQVIVSEEKENLTVATPDGNIVFYAPVTAGSEHEPLPMGRWKVLSIKRMPVFYYNPELFWQPDATDSTGKIAAGPNNPVGIVWIGINAPHYGLHGSPDPDKIGHSESNGCVRMTNWDAEKVAGMIRPGTEVIFQ